MPGTQQSDRKGLKSTNSFCSCWMVCSREVRSGEAFCGNFCVSCLYILIQNCMKLSRAGEINSLQDDRGNVTKPHTFNFYFHLHSHIRRPCLVHFKWTGQSRGDENERSPEEGRGLDTGLRPQTCCPHGATAGSWKSGEPCHEGRPGGLNSQTDRVGGQA